MPLPTCLRLDQNQNLSKNTVLYGTQMAINEGGLSLRKTKRIRSIHSLNKKCTESFGSSPNNLTWPLSE